MSGFVNNVLLFPYSAVLRLRNLLYDSNVIRSRKYATPVISFGNITAGGTGKTPHVEMLLEMLEEKGFSREVTVISRGYGRKLRKPLYVSTGDDARSAGDEPLQIKRKFPEVTVAVGSRRESFIQSIEDNPEMMSRKCFILDDGFQYRRIKPSCNIVLVDFNRPIDRDSLIPLGRLRDLPSRIRRADVVIVTKVPELLDPWEMEQWRKRLKLGRAQHMFFTRSVFGNLLPIYSTIADKRYVYSKEIIMFSGIADDTVMYRHLSLGYNIVARVRFNDHHDYTFRDIARLSHLASRYHRAVLVCTEKDAMHILGNNLFPEDLCSRLFYLPMKVEFLDGSMKDRFLKATSLI